jgi:NADPH2:quinone reductase
VSTEEEMGTRFAGRTAISLVSERLSLDDVADGVRRLADGVTVGRVVYEAGAPR